MENNIQSPSKTNFNITKLRDSIYMILIVFFLVLKFSWSNLSFTCTSFDQP